ncbi:toxin-activating lysine-acyltransferase [Cupriavidus alkaliphilus]|uniref:toxin-activating lysine-acyltransferase n=1 Tax=Cupriavidus alkaliphilus TaxID=942866 RepID=UPI001827B81B|nr:toxin-activating lysine-acyltransferase [Cupriavidus alkaliphilus]MBB2919761.1 hemolysin-activating ACP:hemolysin acyltransferase [Cupriavidus alkaliphilus]
MMADTSRNVLTQPLRLINVYGGENWAYLSDAVVERFARPPYQLAPGDWKSGDKAFLIDVFAPYGGAKDVLADLKATVFKGKVLHQLAPEGERTMRVLED